MNYRVRAVRVKQHDEEERVHPERSALVGCPERNTLDAPSSSDGPRPVVCTNYWSRIKQDGYVADRTADRDCFPDYLSIILLWYYCFILVRVSHADFDEHNGRTEVRRNWSKTLATVRAHTPRPQPHQPHHRRFETRVVSNRNGIIIQTSGTTTKHRGGTRCGYFFTTTTIRIWNTGTTAARPVSNVGNLFICMSNGADQSIRYRVAPPRVSPRRVLPWWSARVCWKLTSIQIIPARPLWHESVELTRLASTAVRAVRKHITSQTNYLQHRLIIHLEHLLNWNFTYFH